MKKVIIVLADGFEEGELIGPYDILTRGGIKVDIFSLNKSNIIGQYNIPLINLPIYNEVKPSLEEYDCLFIVGGREYVELGSSSSFSNLIKYFMENNKLVGAICAGPTLIGRLGYLKNRTYTCYQAMNQDFGGTFISNKKVVEDNNLITSVALSGTLELGLTLLRHLEGEEIERKVRDSIYYDIEK